MARILIVDDEPLIAMMAEEWLSELGHAVVGPAYDLDGALALTERDPPNAAILDLTLGTYDSYPVAGHLRALAIPFAFASGHGRDALAPEFRTLFCCQAVQFEPSKPYRRSFGAARIPKLEAPLRAIQPAEI